ncbi:MAG: glycosyltransferase family 4 protein [Planctomycetes bacterium]|nr:glycosyltransferase family 4 protein [Planctomycetota bacterium]
MRILCLIDSLNSGGAQRQLCVLACLLRKQGFNVHVMTYFDIDFYGHILDENDVDRSVIHWLNRITRIFSVRKAIRKWTPDVVIAFLKTPNLIAEIAGIPARSFYLIVSERNNTIRTTWATYCQWLMHLIADRVVVNSHSQGQLLSKRAPFLKKKLATITNAVYLETYQPSHKPLNNHLKLLVVARFEKQKNTSRFLEAIRIVGEKHPGLKFSVDWFGNRFYRSGVPTKRSRIYLDMKNGIKRNGLNHIIKLHDPVKNIVPTYQACSAFCLPSTTEGFSNVIGEAMACGKPILAGKVGDNAIMVEDNVNGYLFNPYDSKSIAEAIGKFIALTDIKKNSMGIKSRRRAEAILSPEKFIQKYLEILS